MGYSFRHIVVALLLLVFVGLSTAAAKGAVFCANCTDIQVVMDCCSEAHEGSTPGSTGAADHLPRADDCSHERICLNDGQSIVLATTGAVFQFDHPVFLSFLRPQVFLISAHRTALRIFVNSPPKEFASPLYLQNCSLLI